MRRRHALQTLLESIIGKRSDGKQNVYFQPPETIKMVYPCIIYSRSSGNTLFANNGLYNFRTRYQLMVIDRDPDSEIPSKIRQLPLCSYDRHYIADNLNHDVFNLFY